MIEQPYASGTLCSSCPSGTCCDGHSLCAGKLFSYRLEAKSEKGPRNHFRGDGMLEDVTHASSPD